MEKKWGKLWRQTGESAFSWMAQGLVTCQGGVLGMVREAKRALKILYASFVLAFLLAFRLTR